MHLSDGMGICQRRTMRPQPGQPSLWDPLAFREGRDIKARRHQAAIAACRRCPLLEVCEEALSDLERQRQPVDGIMAGRISDCTTHPDLKDRDIRCWSCSILLHPQGHDDPPGPDRRRHVGEGLCSECWPTSHRAARRGTHQKAA